jgi:hypothetical protein
LGLSDEERITKIVWAIRALVEHGQDLKSAVNSDTGYTVPYGSRRSAKELVRLTGKLWHSFLGRNSNGAFWIFGGDHNNEVRGAGGAWSTAILGQCEAHRPDENRDWFEERERGMPFDPFDSALTVSGLLEHPYRNAIYEIYAWSEQLSYALRRYNDKLKKSYKKLDKLISDIQGTCFDLFQRDTGFGKAYVGNVLLKALYADEKAREIFLSDHWHHHLGAGVKEATLTEIIEWDRWRLTHKDTLQNRLVLAMRIMGKRYHYDHQLKKLLGQVEGLGVRKKVIQREFAKCQKAHVASEEENRARYREDRDREVVQAIHGWRFKDELNDEEAGEE